jgi:CBS domain-containing protein
MRVENMMSRGVTTCGPQTTLAEAGRTLRSIDAGILPVVSGGRAVGVITDRDICIALTEKDRRPSEMTVNEAMSRSVLACRPEAHVRRALAAMREKRIRRLPVIDAEGELAGILSLNDVALQADGTGVATGVSYSDVVHTLQRICEHRYPARGAPLPDVTALINALS